MKSKMYSVLMVVVVVAIVGSIAMGNIASPQKPKDLRDFLLQPPNSIYQEYGYSEETFLLYNVIKLIDVCKKYEARIKALEVQVVELKALAIVDPNDITEE